MALTVAQLVARLTADTSGFYRGMALANASMVRTGGLITRAAAGIGLATAGIGIISLRMAGNFQESMNVLQATIHGSDADMQKLSDTAIKLGKDTKLPSVSAQDAAKAMTELGRAGFSTQQILEGTRGVLQLGVAADISFSDAALTAARALKAFNLPASDTPRIANLLSATVNKSTASISDLQYGFQAAASQFDQSGMSIEDLAASLGILVDRGLSGEMAGTALKTMMQRLIAPTDKAAGVMKNLGIQIYDQAGNMKSMPEIIKQFQDGMQGLTQHQREQALVTLFGARANQAMVKLMGEGADGWTKYRDSVTGTNAAQQMAEARMKGFNGAVQQLQSNAETLAIQLGIHLLPAATQVALAISHFIGSINPDAIVAFFSAISSGIEWLFKLINGSDYAKAAILGLVAAFVAAEVITGIIAGITAAFEIMTAIMEANPFVLLATAIIGAGVALAYLYTHNERVRAIMQEVFGWIQSNVFPILRLLGQYAMEAAQYINIAFQAMVGYIRAHMTEIKSFLSTAWNDIKAVAKTTWDLIEGVVRAVWPTILAVVKAYMNNMIAFITAAFNILRGIFHTVMALIHGDWNGVWNGLKETASAALNGIVNIVKTILTGLVSVAKALAMSVGKAIVEGMISGAESLAGGFKDAVVGVAKGALDAAKGFLGIGSPSKKAADEIGKPIAEGIILGFLDGTAELPSKMSERLRQALQAAKTEVDNARGQFQTVFGQLQSDVDTAFQAITAAHMTPAEKILDRIVSAHDAAEFKKNLADAQDALGQARQALADYLASVAPTPEELQKISDAQIKVNLAQDKYNETVAKSGENSKDALTALLALHSAQDQLSKAQDALAGVDPAKLAELHKNIADDNAKVQDILYQQRVDSLQKQAAEEDKQYTASRNLQQRHLDALLANFETQMAKHPERAAFWSKKITDTLASFGVSYQAAGKAVGVAFATGMRESFDEVEKSAQAIAALIARYLKLKSPAETGPLSDLDTWWTNLGSTLASGVDTTQVEQVAQALAGAVGPGIGGAGALATSTGALGSNVAYVNVNVEGSLIHQRDLIDSIRAGLQQDANRGRVIGPY